MLYFTLKKKKKWNVALRLNSVFPTRQTCENMCSISAVNWLISSSKEKMSP